MLDQSLESSKSAESCLQHVVQSEDGYLYSPGTFHGISLAEGDNENRSSIARILINRIFSSTNNDHKGSLNNVSE